MMAWIAGQTWLRATPGQATGHAFVQLHQHVDDLDARLAAIEARINVAPVVIDETAYIPIGDVIEGLPVRTMQASNLPTAWAVTGESMNGLPTTGYWAISVKGEVTPTAFGAGGVKKHATVEILVRAFNEFGSGDGKLGLRFT